MSVKEEEEESSPLPKKAQKRLSIQEDLKRFNLVHKSVPKYDKRGSAIGEKIRRLIKKFAKKEVIQER